MGTVQSAKEIGIIKKEQVINIIDSVVQRTTFGGGEGAAEVNIEGSVVQRTEFKGDDEQKRREEEQLRREREEEEKRKKQKKERHTRKEDEENYLGQHKQEQKRVKGQKEERLRREKEEQELRKRQRPVVRAKKESKRSSLPKFLALMLVLGVLVVGYWLMDFDSDNIDAAVEPSPLDIIGMEATAAQIPQGNPADTPAVVTALSSETLETLTNSIGMEFLLIPAGEFKMGSEDGPDREKPVHTVTIEKAYYLGKYEVTQKQWRKVMGSNPSYFKGDDLPVEYVSWYDVKEFIEKLNEIEGMDKYRLPSEAEWEYAARAGTTTRYSFGDDESDLDDYAWYRDHSGSKTHPVGQKQPNPWGLYDMHGNLCEWVQDEWHFKIGDYEGAPTNGSAWENGDRSAMAVRSCCFSDDSTYCRSANRMFRQSGERSSNLGFRLLQEV